MEVVPFLLLRRKPLTLQSEIDKCHVLFSIFTLRYFDFKEKYKMTSLPRGQAMIINIKEFDDPNLKRKGSEFDRRDMKKLLEKKLHFTVTVKDDLSLEEMQKNLDEFSKRPEHKYGDCCVVVIMSHGYQGSGSDPKTSSPFVISCSDGKTLEVEWIIQKFNTVESLKGKPKVFIVQACRAKGSQSFEQIFGDIGNPGRFATDTNNLGGVTVPTDTFVAISTSPYNVSYRDEEEGTLFIQTICSVFNEFAGEMDFVGLMRKVHDEVDKLAGEGNVEQSPELSIRGKSKVLYFNP
ncbi:unnamed protein product [Darwinula stevensoni]|uniref:Caspase-3 n=1 Tax=Darwinula stevensoni TaxID=69355 RepID=A0A7R9ACR9_9CRUS|nr:unnamed protein product [Darwinula stevensoni]CAG0900627.1 unnamed protein product [Darwinula stevensoni]